MIRAVTFDLWGTLLGFTPEISEYWRTARKKNVHKVLRKLGYDYDMSEINKAYDMLDRKIRDDEGLLQTGRASSPRQRFGSSKEMTVSDQVGYFLKLLDVKKIQDSQFTALVKLYSENPYKKLPSLAKNAHECISYLKSKGVKLGIVSNAVRSPGRVLKVILAKHEILKYFDATSFSDEVNVRKPYPKIFLHALSQLGVKASDAVHVGDRLRDDVYGAKKVGMYAVLCRSITPYLPDEEIFKPDATIDELAQLPVALKSIEELSDRIKS